MQKIKELMRKIDIERNTIKRLSLLEELDALVTKIRREEEIKYKKNGNYNDNLFIQSLRSKHLKEKEKSRQEDKRQIVLLKQHQKVILTIGVYTRP